MTDGAAYSFGITNYAPNGNILAVTDSANGSWAYGTGSNFTGGYDDMNRLLMAVPTGKTWSYTYAYDRYGNRWQQNLIGTGGSGTHFSATFDANNHVSDGSVSYDAAGNVMRDAMNSYTYDSQNQMIASLSRSSGSLTCYFYDAFGRRVQKTTGATSCGYPFVGGASLYYVYDVADVIDEVSAPSGGTGTWTRQEIYAAGRHLATFNASAGQAYWDFSDWLGTERARVNAVTGAVAETCTSLPWGDNLQCTGTDQSPLHFTGKERDIESGLDNFGARYDSSAMGRFMSPDPDNDSGFENQDDPQSWNAYSYVRNNPLTLTDPDGRDYRVCVDDGYGGLNCVTYANMTDFKNALKGTGATLQNGQIVVNVNGQNQTVGTYQFFVGPGVEGGGLQDDPFIFPAFEGAGIGGAVSAGRGFLEGLLGNAARETAEGVTAGIAGSTTTEAVTQSVKISGHALLEAGKDGVSKDAIKKVIQVGERYYDPKHNSIVYVVKGGMASGKNVAVATDAITGVVKSVFTSSKSVISSRFIPIN